MSKLGRCALLAVTLAAVPALAQAQAQGNGFLFGAPAGSFTISGGWAAASAGSDLFSFTTNQLTLNRGDFSSPTLAADLAFRIAPQTDITVSSSLSGINKESEFRDYYDNNQQPIQQTTNFRRVPITVGIRQYLTSTGRSIGRLAWVPTRIAPFVGASAGLTWYEFEQSGDFIDFNTSDVFSDRYQSSGWARTAQADVGFDYALGPRFALTTEGKYMWSSGALSSDFSGFHDLDLSGFSTTVGLSVRF